MTSPLQLALQHPSQILHAFPVDAEIVVATACGRTKVNGFCGLIKLELDIIHKLKEETFDFELQSIFLFLDQCGVRELTEDLYQQRFGFIQGFLELGRCDGMAFAELKTGATI